MPDDGHDYDYDLDLTIFGGADMSVPIAAVRGKATRSAAPFDPLPLSPRVWLKNDAGLYQERTGASATTPASADGDPVGTWLDQSGNGNHFVAPADGQRPLLKLAVQNGRNALLFDGLDDVLQRASFASFPAKRGTIFLVGRNSGPQCDWMCARETSTQWIWYGRKAGAPLRWYDNADNLDGGTSDPNAWNVHAVVRSADTTLTYYRDGASDAVLTVANNQPTAQTLTLGGNYNGTNNLLTGYVGQVLVFDTALSVGNVANVFAYLKSWWGTP